MRSARLGWWLMNCSILLVLSVIIVPKIEIAAIAVIVWFVGFLCASYDYKLL